MDSKPGQRNSLRSCRVLTTGTCRKSRTKFNYLSIAKGPFTGEFRLNFVANGVFSGPIGVTKRLIGVLDKMTRRTGPIRNGIRTLLWSKVGSDTLVVDPKSSLDKRRQTNLIAAQILARALFLLVCLILGVEVDGDLLRQVLLMP